MPQSAACRARHLKDLLASVDRLAPTVAARVRSRLSGDDLRVIEEASGVEWLPAGMCLRTVRAVYDVLGVEEFERSERAHFTALYRGVFRAFARGASTIFGFDPASWMRLIPEWWNSTYRNCGTWEVGRGEVGRVSMVLRELPHACVRDPAWPAAVAAALAATLDVARAEGGAEVLSANPATGEVRFALHWSPPRS